MQKSKTFTFSIIATFMLFSFKTTPVNVNPIQASVSKTTGAKAIWKKDIHDFGEITQGTPVSIEFSFTNTGDSPLLISDVTTSCGCTASDYSKEPIAAGKSSTIKVTYNAANKGTFSKTITVRSNGEEAVKVLTIKGMVK